MTQNKISLQVVNSDLPAIKPKETSPYLAALVNGRPLQQLTNIEKKSFLLDCIKVSTFIGGWATKEDEDIKLMITALMPDISGRFRSMTDIEIKEAFVAGAKGYYGENKGGLTVATCIAWMNAYHQDAARQLAKKELESRQKELPRSSALTIEERRERINKAYSKYLTDGSYHDFGNLVYGLLDSEGLITFSAQQKHEFLEQGRRLITSRLELADSLEKKRENEKKLAVLMNDDSEPIAEAKRIALIAFFEACKLCGFDEIKFKTEG